MMELVVSERVIDVPTTVEEVSASIRAGGWCADLHGVSHLGSLLASDRQTLICLFHAPDAEAVRRTQRQLGAKEARVWSATLHGPMATAPLTTQAPAVNADGGAVVLVARDFEAPVSFEDMQARAGRHAWCLEAYRVRYLQSLFSRDRRRLLCLYAAPDAEAVRHVQRQSELPFQSLSAVTICTA